MNKTSHVKELCLRVHIVQRVRIFIKVRAFFTAQILAKLGSIFKSISPLVCLKYLCNDSIPALPKNIVVSHANFTVQQDEA